MVRISRSIVLFGLVLTVPLATAGISITPHPGFIAPPLYFSGTNARAHYYAEITGNSVITNGWLTIGGETVWSLPPPPPPPRWVVYYNVDAKAMFDSSHFASGQSMEVKLHLIVDGVLVTHSYSSIVKNASGSWNFHNLSDGASIAAGYLNSMQYPGIPTLGSTWSAVDYLSGLQNKNVYFVASHGTADYHLAGNSDAVWTGINGQIESYENYRWTHVGLGYPPYNSTAQPALNLLHIYACNCGDLNNFIRGLIPYANAYDKWLENQVVLTYNVFVPTTQSDEHAEIVFSALSEENTILAAKVLLANDPELICWDTNPTPLPPGRDLQLNDIAPYGDEYMRLKSVYMRDHTVGNGWFKDGW